MGQWAATRPDIFPGQLKLSSSQLQRYLHPKMSQLIPTEDFTAKLTKLQSSTRTHPWNVAEKTLTDAFGKGNLHRDTT